MFFLKRCKELGNYLIIRLHNDDVEKYKRKS